METGNRCGGGVMDPIPTKQDQLIPYSINNNNNNNNNNNRFDMKHFPERPPLNLAFENLCYKVKQIENMKLGDKQILFDLTGEFRSGELTAIMGPSGAGKSSLLNILAGFRVRGSEGKVLINGEDRKDIGLDEFKKFSCYILQEDEPRVFLTVEEAMMFASHLKLGHLVSRDEKIQKNTELLQMLGLGDHKMTLCGRISGGQKKRLSIALELITNPPVIFLDEPTTGLDSSSSSSCISLLKSLASQGRTIVCTIHQPSALIFEQFSQLYCITQGRCLYQGSPADVPSTLKQYGFVCPPYHNPADYIIEVTMGEHGLDVTNLVKHAEKIGQETLIKAVEKIPESQRGLRMYSKKEFRLSKKMNSVTSLNKYWRPTKVPFWYQYYQLYSRNVLTFRRNYFYVILRIMAHFLISILFGYLYRNNGKSADTLFGNGIYIYGTNLFLNYTALMTVLLSFPLEYKILIRENFNRWYNLFPYCLALILIELPFQMFCAMVYIIPSYLLTAQPLEWFRFGLFVLFNLAITFTALGMGFLSGAIFPITIAVFIAPAVAAFFSAFGFTLTTPGDLNIFFVPFYYTSYFRAGFQGSAFALYGYGRPDLECNRLMYCHFRNIPMAIRALGFYTFDFNRDLSIMLLFGFVTFILTFAFVAYRLHYR